MGKLWSWLADLLRCGALSRRKQRCYLTLWHRGRHRYRPVEVGRIGGNVALIKPAGNPSIVTEPTAAECEAMNVHSRTWPL